MRARLLMLFLSSALASSATAQTVAPAAAQVPVQAVDLNAGVGLDDLAAKLAAKRVVFIGEIHDRYDHHLNQLELIRRLHQLDPTIAIGVEYFQQPFQSQVDDYIAGKTSETEFLRSTEYFSRWGFDYRLYAPIFRYAREQHIPVRALNVPSSLVFEVARTGIAALPDKDRAYLPHDMQPADQAYRQRLFAAFQEHGDKAPGAFDHFVEAQLIWDEGMAESAAVYLSANPNRRMIILAGEGHFEFGSGIPSRLERRTHATAAIVLSSGGDVGPHVADYLLLSPEQDLPPAGSLGVNLAAKNGECRIASLTPTGAASAAGLHRGDVLISIDGQPTKSPADAKLALWNKNPGDTVPIDLRRHRFLRHPGALAITAKLTASP